MILSEDAIAIHSKLINAFGGKDQVRDFALLDAALNRPFQTFDGIDLYSNPIDKAAAVLRA